MEKIANVTNVKIYSWNIHSDMRDLLRYRFPIFTDLVYPNDIEHTLITNDIKQIVQQAKPKCSNKLGSWGDSDFCVSWFQNGVN